MQDTAWPRAGAHMIAMEDPASERSGLANVESCLEVLRKAALWDGDGAAPAVLRTEIGELARAARAAGLRPEQLITIVKESWGALPEVRRATDEMGMRDRLSGIITVCICEFFGE